MPRAVLGILLVAAAPAAAQPAPITHRDWTLDLHSGAVIGSVRIVGMGGAQVALAEGSAGTLSNPAAPAVRPATSTEWWDWDFHVDALQAVTASDFDNDGVEDDDRSDRRATFGLAGMLYDWGLAAVGDAATTTLSAAEGELVATAALAKVALAWSPGDETWAAGVAVRAGTLTIEGADGELFSIGGAGLEAGAVYKPFGRDLRLGATGSLPITGTTIDAETCDPMNCHGYILPLRVAVPWQLAIGAAWRRAPTRWNQWVGGRFRDERALIVAADVVVTGAIDDGMGFAGFGRGVWQESGRKIAVSARAGVEWEALPGRLRLRGGTYWEPSQYSGVSGRPHVTAGVELGFFTFRFWWKKRYRLRLGATGDFAPRFGNAGLSLGFWH